MSDWASALSWGGGEAELVHELQAGSETAFDWLVTHYHAPVYNLILGMLGDTSDAADGTQEVFLKAFRGICKFRQGSSLKTWLYRIAIRGWRLRTWAVRPSSSWPRTKFRMPCRARCSRCRRRSAAR